MIEINNYLEANKERFLSELFDLIRIPSVSARHEHKQDMVHAAEFVKEKLLKAGADKAEVIKTKGHPIVYGEKIVDKSLPTVLVYGHYDVQPVEPLDLWDHPPFEPVVKDGYIYARGANDDKGQMYMHIKAFETMVATQKLDCNVKFMIEGEEEVGSPNLEVFIKNNKSKLKANVILVSDTSMLGVDMPSINVGLRGLAYVEVEVTGPNRDLHSGVYGGAVANPINILCDMISSLKDQNNKIVVPGFYDDVHPISDEERANLAKIPFDVEKYKRELGIDEIKGEAGYSTIERTTIRPALDVNGIWGGYIEEGSKTVLPSKAYAKISMRLVPNQNPYQVVGVFTKYFESIAPPFVKVTVTNHHGGEPYYCPIDSDGYRAASMAMETTFGKKPISTRSGGSIPIISLFEKELGLKSILMGFGLESDAIHSPNERYGLFNFYKGIETIPYFYKYFNDLTKQKLNVPYALSF